MSPAVPPDDDTAGVLGIEHTGIVVPDLEAAVAFYTEAFGLSVLWREPDVGVDDVAIGLPGEEVRLRGAMLTSGSGMVELHEYLSPRGPGVRQVSDTGLGHLAFSVADIDAAHERLTGLGMRFNTPPQTIRGGPLDGRRWVYGQDPWGVVIELAQSPEASA